MYVLKKLKLNVYHLALRFYVGCDLCNDWFHGSCVGLTEEEAKFMDEFMCKECSKQNKTVEERKLYCLCKQPYDDSKYVTILALLPVA